MTVNLWGAIGYGFPAFRTLLQGIPSKFENGKYVKGGDGNNNDVDIFGSKTDNYKYANMLFNEYQEEQILDNVVVCINIYFHFKRSFPLHKKCSIIDIAFSTDRSDTKCNIN